MPRPSRCRCATTRCGTLLHAEPVFGFTDRYRVEGTIRRLNDLGFAVDELSLQPDSADPSRLRVRVAVGDRRYHAQHLQELTGLDVGEGQAAHPARRPARLPGAAVPGGRARRRRVDRRAAVGHRGGDPVRAVGARGACGHTGTPIQAYCDLLEVRWLLSEKAGRDVGTNKALAALAGDVIPADSAAKMASPRCRRSRSRCFDDDDERLDRGLSPGLTPYGSSGLSPTGVWVKICDEAARQLLSIGVWSPEQYGTWSAGRRPRRGAAIRSAPGSTCSATKSIPTWRTSRNTGLVERYERVRLTNPDKVLYPATGTTKAEVFDYYVAIADVMVPHIAGRPVTRKRWPNGVGAAGLLREAAGLVGAGLAGPRVASRTSRAPPPTRSSTPARGWPGSRSRRRWKCTCRSGGSSTVGEPGPATRIVFDLDPGEDVTFRQLCEVAHEVRGFITDIGLTTYPAHQRQQGAAPLRPAGRSDQLARARRCWPSASRSSSRSPCPSRSPRR